MDKLLAKIPFVLCGILLVASLRPTCATEDWPVPQLGITSLDPILIEPSPTDPNILAVVNSNGRIDVIRLQEASRAVKVSEIWTTARCATFSPTGTILSGRSDGSVQEWTLRGKEIEDSLFKSPGSKPRPNRHQAPVYCVKTSPNGSYVVSGDDKGTLILRSKDKRFRTLSAHSNRVTDIAFTPDESRFISGSFDGTVCVWNEDGTKERTVSTGHQGKILSVAFLPSRNLIITAGEDGTLRFSEIDGKNPGAPFFAGSSAISSLAVSQDDYLIAAGGSDGTVRLWTTNGTPLDTSNLWHQGHQGSVKTVAFSPDGTRLISGSADKTLRIWTLTGNEASSPYNTTINSSLTLNPSTDQIVFSSSSGRLTFWSPNGKTQTKTFQGHQKRIRGVDYSPNGARFASASDDGTIGLWGPDGTKEASLQPSQGPISCVSFSRDSRYVAAGNDDGSVHYWDLDLNRKHETFPGHDDRVTEAVFSPDSKLLVTGGADSTIRFWPLDIQTTPLRIDCEAGQVSCLAFSLDGTKIVSGHRNGSIEVWNRRGQKITTKNRAHDSLVRGLAFSPNGIRFVSGGGDGKILLWTFASNTLVPTEILLERHLSINDLRFSQDGTRIVASCSDRTIRIWTLSLASAPEVRGCDSRISSVSFSPDGKHFATGQIDGGIRLWTLEKREPISLDGHDGEVRGIAFSPSGNRFVGIGEDRRISVWKSTETSIDAPPLPNPTRIHSAAFSPEESEIFLGRSQGKLLGLELGRHGRITPFPQKDGWVKSIAVSPSGTEIAAAYGPFVTSSPSQPTSIQSILRIWSRDKKLLEESTFPSLTSLAFSPSGDELLTGGGDNIVRFSQTDEIQKPRTLFAHIDGVTKVCFSPDGKKMISGGADGAIILWQSGRDEMLVKRQLSSGVRALEWAKTGFIFAWTGDRIHILDSRMDRRGEVFLDRDQWTAMTSDGVYAPTEDLHSQFVMTAEDHSIQNDRGSVPSIDAALARRLLIDDVSLWGSLLAFGSATLNFAQKAWKVLRWYPVLAIPWILCLFSWRFFPSGLSSLTMYLFSIAEAFLSPSIQKTTKGAFLLAQVLFPFYLLGNTRRALGRWVEKHHAKIIENLLQRRQREFSSQTKFRKHYCDLGNAQLVREFLDKVEAGDKALLWIEGVGGSGKSALAFHIVDKLIAQKDTIPLILDEDWHHPLLSHLAGLTNVLGQKIHPNDSMVKKMLERGDAFLLADSLGERRTDDAQTKVETLLKEANPQIVIVTSRKPLPDRSFWGDFDSIRLGSVQTSDIQEFIGTYEADPLAQRTIRTRLGPLLQLSPEPNPLLLRLAIDQASIGGLDDESKEKLVIRYLEGLRSDRIDVAQDDMVRACELLAKKACPTSGSPLQDLDASAIGEILDTEAIDRPFYRDDGTTVARNTLLGQLTEAGVLARHLNQLQFTSLFVARELAKR